MDFQPFTAPPSDHHPLNSGLGTENGVTAKGLIDGLNTYLAHLFAAVEGKVATVAGGARALTPDKFVANVTAQIADFHTRISAVEDGIVDLKKLVQEVRPMLEAFLTIAHGNQVAPAHQATITDPTHGIMDLSGQVPPNPEQPVDAQGKAAPRNRLADVLAGISTQ